MTVDKTASDNQLFQEIAKNERIVEHPAFGTVRLRFPTLEIQRKIDSLVRTKKKILKEAKDEIPDPSAPSGVRYVPAFKSREFLLKEYSDLGWWSSEQEERLNELSKSQIVLMAELEVLGFEGENEIFEEMNGLREKLLNSVIDNIEDKEEAKRAVFNITIVGSDPPEQDVTYVKDNATSTETDEFLERVFALNRLFTTYSRLAQNYSELLKLQSEQSTLFADSWQDQLQYFTRLAQVYYCIETVRDRKPLWATLSELEADSDSEKVMWAFNELAMFWQGITDETRDKVEKYSFTLRRNTEPQQLEDSQEDQNSLSDGNIQENEPISSSEVSDITEK